MIPPNFTGADFYGLITKTVMSSSSRKIAEVELLFKERSAKMGDIQYPFSQFISEIESEQKQLLELAICKEDFATALKNIQPSVSEQEIKIYNQIKSSLSK